MVGDSRFLPVLKAVTCSFKDFAFRIEMAHRSFYSILILFIFLRVGKGNNVHPIILGQHFFPLLVG